MKCDFKGASFLATSQHLSMNQNIAYFQFGLLFNKIDEFFDFVSGFKILACVHLKYMFKIDYLIMK